MDKVYPLVNDHLRTAEMLLIARDRQLEQRLDKGVDVNMERDRVGGLLRSIRRAERDMVYWFDPNKIDQDPLPFALEKEYYDQAGVPEKRRFLKEQR